MDNHALCGSECGSFSGFNFVSLFFLLFLFHSRNGGYAPVNSFLHVIVCAYKFNPEMSFIFVLS